MKTEREQLRDSIGTPARGVVSKGLLWPAAWSCRASRGHDWCDRGTAAAAPRRNSRFWPAALLLLASVACACAQNVGNNINLTRAAGNQSETAVAIDPNDNNRMFVVSRNELGGLYAARSTDGGATWTTQWMARSNSPQPGDLPRAYGNASVAWDGYGNLFLAYLSQGSIRAGTYVCLAVSIDGGATFYSPDGKGSVVMLPVNPPKVPLFGDQPTVTVGPGSAGYPGSVWVTYWTEGGIVVSGAGVSGSAAIGAFSSWLPVQPAAVNYGDIAVGPSGEVMIVYGPNAGLSGSLYTNVKLDGLGPGDFSTYSVVTPINVGGFTGIPAQPNWGIDPEAGLAWDRTQGPHRGRVYLVYTDAPSLGSTDTDIMLRYSDDQGVTWSAPLRVNDDKGTNSQFLPHISLDQSNGMLAVTWYDARNSALNKTAEYFGAFSSDAGASFSPNFKLSTGISDQSVSQPPLNIKKTDFGDYTGNAFVGGRLVAAWADNSNSTGDNPDGATDFDIYAAVVTPTVTTAACHNALFRGGNMKYLPYVLALAAGSICSGAPITFDFNTGTPALFVGQLTPFSQTSGGLLAQFSSSGGTGISVQQIGAQTLSLFSGPLYIGDANADSSPLAIAFGQSINSISFPFATADFHQMEFPTLITLTAYTDSTRTTTVGSSTARGTYGTDTMPMGTLSFTSATSFAFVEIVIAPSQLAPAGAFFLDDITVNPSGAAIPEPGTGLLVLASGLLFVFRRARR